MELQVIPYTTLLREARESDEPIHMYLRRELFWLWSDAYLLMSDRPSDLISYTCGTFDYLFDTYDPGDSYDVTSGIPPVEARLVAAFGKSKPKRSKRDDGRLKGFRLLPMPEVDGVWDRGHFIGHSIGGIVDGNEANVFLQLRSVNRGPYRRMEAYCFKHPGVLCFSRPIYTDPSAHPSQIEFGILKPDGEFWIEIFPNRLDTL